VHVSEFNVQALLHELESGGDRFPLPETNFPGPAPSEDEGKKDKDKDKGGSKTESKGDSKQSAGACSPSLRPRDR
jgi:hypothetical protein